VKGIKEIPGGGRAPEISGCTRGKKKGAREKIALCVAEKEEEKRSHPEGGERFRKEKCFNEEKRNTRLRLVPAQEIPFYRGKRE